MLKLEIEIPNRVYEIIMNDETSPSIPIIKKAIKQGKIIPIVEDEDLAIINKYKEEESKESLMAYRKWKRESMAKAYEKVTIDVYLKKLSRQLEDNFEKYNQDGYCTLDNFFKGTGFEPYLRADAHLKGVVNWNRIKED